MMTPFFPSRIVPLLLAAACFFAMPAPAAVPYPRISGISVDPAEGSEVTEGSSVTVRANITDATGATLGAQLLTADGQYVTGIGAFGNLQPVSAGSADYALTFQIPEGYMSRVGPDYRLGLRIEAQNVDPETGTAYAAQSGTLGRYKVTANTGGGNADLSVAVVDSPDTIPLGDLIAYTATVNNQIGRAHV